MWFYDDLQVFKDQLLQISSLMNLNSLEMQVLKPRLVLKVQLQLQQLQRRNLLRENFF